MKSENNIDWPDMPDCGVYLVWPQPGTAWIHPDDVATAELWIPSTRVFRRHSFDGTYYRLQYGEQSIRVKPSLWTIVPDEHLWLGDQVEILGDFRTNEPWIASIQEIRFNQNTGRIQYSLVQRELALDRAFHVEDLRGLVTRPQLTDTIESFTREVPSDSVEVPFSFADDAIDRHAQ